MYIVLTAMLALNVSSDVLDGFVQVEDGLARTNVNVIERNDALYSRLERIAADNPEKGSRWLDKASDVRRRAGELYRHVDITPLLKRQLLEWELWLMVIHHTLTAITKMD